MHTYISCLCFISILALMPYGCSWSLLQNMHLVQSNILNFDRNFAQQTSFEKEGRVDAAKGGQVAHPPLFSKKKKST